MMHLFKVSWPLTLKIKKIGTEASSGILKVVSDRFHIRGACAPLSWETKSQRKPLYPGAKVPSSH